MRIAIHQPHYLPWLGYVEKVDRVDKFVFLDHVQYERRGWQNRNYVKVPDGKVMLTVPVVQRSQHERIIDKRIDDGHSWRFKHRRTIEQFYRGASFWDKFGESLLALYDEEYEWLVDLSIASVKFALAGFGVNTPLVRATEVGNFHSAKTELIAEICAAVGATTYVSGVGARNYLDVAYLEEREIAVEWQEFQSPSYVQLFPKAGFVSGLAAFDLLLNSGDDGLGLLRSAQGRDPDGYRLVQPTTPHTGTTS